MLVQHGNARVVHIGSYVFCSDTPRVQARRQHVIS